jgi:haloalkane dehalogenase
MSWLDREEYPFTDRFLPLPAGRMHYVDEGEGPPIVFVHGNPGWSYEFRKAIRALSPVRRCIAPDHLGFGLSDKPADWDYLPSSHAENFRQFIGHLGPERFVLAVNDWGGPIGLSYALGKPEKIAHLVITNTWMWSVKKSIYYQTFSRFAGGPIGRWLIRRYNLFGKVILRRCYADPSRLDPAVYAHLRSPEERKGCWTFPGQIVGSGDWLAELWRRREALREIPKTFIWGMKDIAFREKELEQWLRAMPEARAVRIADAGHHPHEEAPERFIAELQAIAP